MKCNDKYRNDKKQFSSDFLSFEGGASIVIMHRPEISKQSDRAESFFGLTYFAISVGSWERVDELTDLIRKAGYQVTAEPRNTEDGYYESVVADPEGNLLEISE